MHHSRRISTHVCAKAQRLGDGILEVAGQSTPFLSGFIGGWGALYRPCAPLRGSHGRCIFYDKCDFCVTLNAIKLSREPAYPSDVLHDLDTSGNWHNCGSYDSFGY